MHNSFNVKCITMIANSSMTRKSIFIVELLLILTKIPFDLGYDNFKGLIWHYIKLKRLFGKSRIPQPVGDRFTFLLLGVIKFGP